MQNEFCLPQNEPYVKHRLAEKRIGHEITSHTINSNEIFHARTQHGLNGKNNTAKNIPLCNEDFGLIPYIMSCPTSIQKGTPQKTGQKSIRYIKNISNGIIICVEVEGAIKEAQMANITMWAETSSYTNAMVAGKPASYNTSETTVISSEDIAKIINDAETVIRNEDYLSSNAIGRQLSIVGVQPNGVIPLVTNNSIIYGWQEGDTITLSFVCLKMSIMSNEKAFS